MGAKGDVLRVEKIANIFPNPNQPRRHFDTDKLKELATSIKSCGLLEPLVVVQKGDRFMIIAGERRWRASQIAGLSEVSVCIKDADDRTVAELSLLENLQREDLNVIEIANAYKELLGMGLTQGQIAEKMGHSHVWLIEERLSLLNLHETLQDFTVKGILTPAQAFQLSRLPRDTQGQVFDKISTGKIKSHEKLKSLVNAILFTREQVGFLPEPTPQEREVNTKYDRMIEQIINFINRCFNRDDMTILAAVLSPAAKQNIERIDMIVLHLNKIKRALLKADSALEVLEQTRLNS